VAQQENPVMGQETIHYDDKTVRYFVWATLLWGIVGMTVGLLIALQLAWWPANTHLSWLSFGRLRPLHTNAVIFAFTCNAMFAGMYYSLQRLCKARLFNDTLSKVHFWGWQAIIVAAAITLPLGWTQGKEYAELEWPIDIAVAVIWLVMAANVFGTIFNRRVRHLYVAIWFYMGSILTITMLHVVNSLVVPVSLGKSYSVYAGVQDALVQWWYGHNAVGFLLTTPFLGLMYYFVPKAAGRPVYSYRLSIIHFWALFFIYIWAGPHHLLYTSLPEWAQSLGMVFSLMLIAPSWGGMLNGLLTLRGAWDRVRHEPALKFFVLALTFYGMSTLEGPLMSIKSWNLITHYTDYTVAHVHGGALGWVGGMVFAMFYYLVPKLYQRPLYSEKLATQHFWMATLGILFYVISMWAAGITQGLMWFAKSADGTLKYPNFLETVLALKSLYWARVFGGLLYLVGTIMWAYNLYRTAAAAPADESAVVTNERVSHAGTGTFHSKLETNAGLMALLVTIAIMVGGIIEFVPSFLIESNVPTITSVKPYSPLELEGRDIYVREGCYNCHSQMVRVTATEVQRWGERAYSGEFVYDHPFQWGSKRTGPDLLRLGGKYPDVWHYKHMMDPRETSPGSIMPAYPWLRDASVDPEGTKTKLIAMRMLGVPYEKAIVENPIPSMIAQDEAIRGRLREQGVETTSLSEIVALTAYLQRLGMDLKSADRTQLERQP
jgi:cytochrome c oxidase cbb3-type subunit I/II